MYGDGAVYPLLPLLRSGSVQGLRRDMEDEHVAARPLVVNSSECANLFGVFDGHGGQRCSKYLQEHLATAIQKRIEHSWHQGSTEEALKMAFREVDTAFLNSSIGTEEVGSTAVVVMVKGRTLYCANTGDSRAILCRANGVATLSCDHKPNRPDEKSRIQRAGGSVIYNRVMGRLGVSRAFGDQSLKTFVIADPDVVTLQLERGDDFLVLACDGLWDVVEPHTVEHFVRLHSAPHEKCIYCMSPERCQSLRQEEQLQHERLSFLASALTTYAIRNGSNDNVTCMVVALEGGSGGRPL